MSRPMIAQATATPSAAASLLGDTATRCIRTAFHRHPAGKALTAAAQRALASLTAQAPCPKLTGKTAPGWSRLTHSGLPLDFSFGPRVQEIDLTTEVAGPNVDVAERLGLASERLHRLGHVLDPLDLMQVEELQSGHGLNWGAWVGLRLRPTSLTARLFVEIPDESHFAALRWLDTPSGFGLTLTKRGGRVRMVALSDDGQPELYFALHSVSVQDLPEIYAALGQAQAGALLVDQIAQIAPDGFDATRPHRAIGLRLKQTHNGTLGGGCLLTTHLEASELFANDRAARAALARPLPELGWTPEGYTAFTKDQPQLSGARQHGTLGLTPLPNGSCRLRVSVSPAVPVGWTQRSTIGQPRIGAPHPVVA